MPGFTAVSSIINEHAHTLEALFSVLTLDPFSRHQLLLFLKLKRQHPTSEAAVQGLPCLE